MWIIIKLLYFYQIFLFFETNSKFLLIITNKDLPDFFDCICKSYEY